MNTAASAAPRATRGSRIALAALAALLLLAFGCAKPPIASVPPPAAPSAKENAVVKTARSQLGARYKAGGATPAGFDCSGLVFWVFSRNGVSLPRETKSQSKAGWDVAEKDLRPGDLVVFDISYWSGLHVGICTGRDKFIHSPSSGRTVREDSLNDPYWRKRFVTARRVL